MLRAMSDYNVDTSRRFPIKAWTKGVQVEDVAVEQLRNIANMPFIHKHGAGECEEQQGLVPPASLNSLGVVAQSFYEV